MQLFDAISLPALMIALSTAVFLCAERLFPGRELPQVKGWYGRALLLNIAQLCVTAGMGRIWGALADGASLFHLSRLHMPVLEGFIGWFAGTFFFYWWHRLRHRDGFWRVFHQIHHSPARIEVLTAFYKHPVEILVGNILSASVLFALLGVSPSAGAWYNFFAATGEYFYHANLKTPRWLKYFIQTPELHSIHHQLNVHNYNFADIPLWDRLFGTYKDADAFMPRCGFPRGNERKLGPMLIFRDVYEDK